MSLFYFAKDIIPYPKESKHSSIYTSTLYTGTKIDINGFIKNLSSRSNYILTY